MQQRRQHNGSGIEEYNKAMAVQMSRLLRQYGSFERIPRGQRSRYTKRIDVEQETGSVVVVITPKPPADLHREIESLRRDGFAQEWGAKGGKAPAFTNMPVGGKATMERFYRNMRWFTTDERGVIKRVRPQWKDSPIEVHHAAVRFLYEQVLRKDPRTATYRDLDENGLAQLRKIHGGDTYSLVSGAFPELGIKPWELPNTPVHLFDDPETCRAATRWLVEVRLRRDPLDVTGPDFTANGLATLINRYRGSAFAAVADAYPELNLRPADKPHPPNGTWKERENRVYAIRKRAGEACEEAGKEARDLKVRELKSLWGILRLYYGNNFFEMLLDAGVVTEEDRGYMQGRYRGRARSVNALKNVARQE